MKIVEKIIQSKKDIQANGEAGEDVAVELGRLATNAIRYGMDSEHWKFYMEKFTTDEKELNRLLGKDDRFNETEWSYKSLAYIVANSTCTVDSGTTGPGFMGTVNGFEVEMLVDLNAEFEDAPIPD